MIIGIKNNFLLNLSEIVYKNVYLLACIREINLEVTTQYEKGREEVKSKAIRGILSREPCSAFFTIFTTEMGMPEHLTNLDIQYNINSLEGDPVLCGCILII